MIDVGVGLAVAGFTTIIVFAGLVVSYRSDKELQKKMSLIEYIWGNK